MLTWTTIEKLDNAFSRSNLQKAALLFAFAKFYDKASTLKFVAPAWLAGINPLCGLLAAVVSYFKTDVRTYLSGDTSAGLIAVISLKELFFPTTESAALLFAYTVLAWVDFSQKRQEDVLVQLMVELQFPDEQSLDEGIFKESLSPSDRQDMKILTAKGRNVSSFLAQMCRSRGKDTVLRICEAFREAVRAKKISLAKQTGQLTTSNQRSELREVNESRGIGESACGFASMEELSLAFSDAQTSARNVAVAAKKAD